MNLRIMGHPLNWLIVLVVAVLGAMFWMHATMGAQQVSHKVRMRNSEGEAGLNRRQQSAYMQSATPDMETFIPG